MKPEKAMQSNTKTNGSNASNCDFDDHNWAHVEVQQNDSLKQPDNVNAKPTTSQSSQQCRILVDGLPNNATDDLVWNYFENKRRSSGGPVSQVVMNSESRTCQVTFECPDDASRAAQQSTHKLHGVRLCVSLIEEFEMEEKDDSLEDKADELEDLTIIVSGLPPSATEDAVCYYFENSRRSGGGEVLNIDFNDIDNGKAMLTFKDVSDLQRLLEGEHRINKKPVEVRRRPPKKKVPLDPVRVHVQGLNLDKTSKDCLALYLEKFSNVEVKEIYFGPNDNALAVFNEEPDFPTLFDKVHKDYKGVEGRKPRLERVTVCTCIQVTGLKVESSDDTIELYFENEKRSGGKDIQKVERKWKDEALVFFEDPSSVKSVIRKEHKLEGNKLTVMAYYPFLHNTTKKKTDIQLDPDVLNFIQRNHDRELQEVSKELKIQIEHPNNPESPVIISISPADNRKDSNQSWDERVEDLKNFLENFQKSHLDIPSEIFDEIVKRWKADGSSDGSSDFLTSFDKNRRLVQVTGKRLYVAAEMHKIEELTLAVKEDRELMKTVVEVVEDNIPESRLKLLEMSGICEKLRNDHQHLTISVDSTGEKLFLKGPRCLLQEVKVEIFKFISKIVDKTTEIPGKLVDVLRKPEVSRFMLDLLKEKGIGAVLLYDQNQVSNEVTVVGVDSTNAKHAEKILLDAVRERSLRLTPENAALIQSSLWRNFKSSLSPNCMVQVSEDISCGTVWTSGIARYVDECFDKITDFLERNTILCKTIQAEYGVTFFLSEVWKTKIQEIKTKFADYSIDIRTAPNRQDIEVSGTEVGLQKCLPKVRELIDSIRKRSVQVDKPGMKKFFTKEKGESILKSTGAKHRCVIIAKEHSEDEIAAHHSINEEVQGSTQELVCSYVTRQGKTISVLKGDITKENVDVIVNAANGDLKHIGGLAAAIVEAGGKEIQFECDKYVRDKGSLFPGQIMVSTAGKLACKKVIHAVGPKWDYQATKQVREGDETKQERYLKYAVTNSVKEAMKYNSIAIPAISSGVFGFPRELCAKVILNAVLEFCEENAACRLSEIHLINNDSTTVRAFEAEMRERFAAERNFRDHKDHSPDTAIALGANYGPGVFGMSKTPRSLMTPQGIRITMKQGDLAKEQADIIVGTAASNLNLNHNPCAKALSLAAGPRLQQECSNIGQVTVGNIVVINSPGKLHCKAVIFAICCEWSAAGARKVLKGLLQKCLKTASTKGMASISFPSIGTGTLQFPRAEVAKIYFDEVLSFSRKNPQTSIKEVRFVLYDQDPPTVQAFDLELQKRMQGNAPSPVKRPQSSFTTKPAFSTMKERKQDHLETSVGSLCFKAHPGDITKETTEAIVVISNAELDISKGGGAGAAILKKGGLSIQNECSQKGPQPPGSVVITNAGSLKVRSILHIVPSQPVTEDSIKSWVITCLQKAEKAKMSSISFPAIGTGNLGLSAKQSAKVMLSAIQDFSNKRPSSMQIVKMVVFQEEMMKDVRSAIEEASGNVSQEKAGWLWKLFNFLGFVESDQTLPQAQTTLGDLDTKLELLIFAGCQEDLQKAVKEINGIIQETSTRKEIEREAVTMLSSQHYRKLHALELKYDVKATVEKEVGRIMVSGQTEDILNAIGEVHTLLDRVKEEEDKRKQAEVLSKVIQWRYQNGDTDAFEPFEPLVNAKIEAAYDKKKSGVEIGDGHCRIDFKLMNMEIRGYGVTDVQRVNHRDLLPKHWTPQPKDHSGFEKTVHLCQLDPTNDAKEYQRVESQFRQTCPNNNIVKIERVQNPVLYETYAIRKKKMDETKGSNEMSLFHGTPGDNCKHINNTGFNRSFHGKNATMYGNGVYFALQASYSARSTYSPPDASGCRYMYLTKVLVGEYTMGRQGLITPPPKNLADPTDTYDTVVDQIPNPSIFVVFYDWQCYPEYLITFQ